MKTCESRAGEFRIANSLTLPPAHVLISLVYVLILQFNRESGLRLQRLDEVRGLFREYAGLVREHFGERVKGIWLYGSAARGDWTDDSDIDVLVLLDREETRDMTWLITTAYRIGLSERHLLLQPVMLTQKEFDHLLARERRFARDVLREGIAA